jgi:outer membrane receptor for ferrienterochelin and colicins
MADQRIFFGQLTWNKTLKNHDLLTGLAYRYTYYDDNTPATPTSSHTHLPGLFVQDEITLHQQHKLLVGARYDYNSIHGSIVSPRVNYKWNSQDKSQVLRVGVGNGYRVANVFTEDHAALTGARDVVFKEDLKPETSWNANINYVKKFYSDNGSVFAIDASTFYTYFNNKIIPDYETNVNQIIYANLDGYAISKGVSVNLDWAHHSGLKAMIGGTLMDVYSEENGERTWQMLTEKFMGTWTIGYKIKPIELNIDYTGNAIGPMRLPVLGDGDERPDKSKLFSIQNIQLTKHFNNGFEVFGGVKNFLNWTPTKGLPFLISRSHDPFEKIEDPNLLPFDPNYVYGPNQGIRGFLGVRYNLFQ